MWRTSCNGTFILHWLELLQPSWSSVKAELMTNCLTFLKGTQLLNRSEAMRNRKLVSKNGHSARTEAREIPKRDSDPSKADPDRQPMPESISGGRTPGVEDQAWRASRGAVWLRSRHKGSPESVFPRATYVPRRWRQIQKAGQQSNEGIYDHRTSSRRTKWPVGILWMRNPQEQVAYGSEFLSSLMTSSRKQRRMKASPLYEIPSPSGRLATSGPYGVKWKQLIRCYPGTCVWYAWIRKTIHLSSEQRPLLTSATASEDHSGHLGPFRVSLDDSNGGFMRRYDCSCSS